jgi:hypothetical protein
MFQLDNRTNKQIQLLIYKILNEALFLWAVVFSGLLVLEGLVPGYFSAYISFTKMIFALFAILGAIGYLGRKNNLGSSLPPDLAPQKNRTLIILLALSFILILNALRGFGWPVALIGSAGALWSVILLYRIFIPEQ